MGPLHRSLQSPVLQRRARRISGALQELNKAAATRGVNVLLPGTWQINMTFPEEAVKKRLFAVISEEMWSLNEGKASMRRLINAQQLRYQLHLFRSTSEHER